MTRAEMMRQARSTVQVTFAEYLKNRAPDAQMLIFEGKNCPTFYIGKITLLLEGQKIRQLVARGKKNVLELKELVERNNSTANDEVFYFVDRDFDVHPQPGEIDRVYVTRGYAIENECIDWDSIENFMRANFDIADSDDENALSILKSDFHMAIGHYRNATRSLNNMIFVCRRNSIRCLPGEDAGKFLEIDFNTHSVRERLSTLDDLALALQVPTEQKAVAISQMSVSRDFDNLDWRLQWRGKYHFDFLRRFLIWAATARISGTAPFKRAAKPVIDPAHPGLMGLLFACIPTPSCLVDFVHTTSQKR